MLINDRRISCPHAQLSVRSTLQLDYSTFTFPQVNIIPCCSTSSSELIVLLRCEMSWWCFLCCIRGLGGFVLQVNSSRSTVRWCWRDVLTGSFCTAASSWWRTGTVQPLTCCCQVLRCCVCVELPLGLSVAAGDDESVAVHSLDVAEVQRRNSPPGRHRGPAEASVPRRGEKHGDTLLSPCCFHAHQRGGECVSARAGACAWLQENSPLTSPLRAESEQRTGAERSSVLDKLEGTTAAGAAHRHFPADQPPPEPRSRRGPRVDRAVSRRTGMDLSRW